MMDPLAGQITPSQQPEQTAPASAESLAAQPSPATSLVPVENREPQHGNTLEVLEVLTGESPSQPLPHVEAAQLQAQASVLRPVIPDDRLYMPSSEGWSAQIKQETQKVYCYQREPGEEWFHLIVQGELYLTNGQEKYCLKCALRLGMLTRNRLYWQRQKPLPQS